jgi:uncharacterized protein YbaP (TraB family)
MRLFDRLHPDRWGPALRNLALLLLALIGLAPAPTAQDSDLEELLKGLAPARDAATAEATDADEQAPIEPMTRPYLWRVEHEGVASYLFGTIHIPDPRVTTLPDNVNEALDSVDGLYVEIPMDMATMGRAMAGMVLPGNKTLKDVLPAELHDRVDAYLQKRGSSVAGFQKFQVWAIDQVLATLDLAEQMKHGAPLDMQLWAHAGERDIERGGLETVEEQLDVFTSLSEAQQIKLLEMNIEEYELAFEEGRSLIGDLTDIYLQGDLDVLMAEMAAYASDDEEISKLLERKLLVDRNLRMTERIIEKLEDNPGKSYFFAVGAAHYPGDFGLINLLAEEGFETERLIVEDEVLVPAGIE